MSEEYTQELNLLLNGSYSLQNEQVNTNEHYLMQQFIYKELAEQNHLLNDSTLNDFYIANQNASIGLLYAINRAMENENFADAKNLNGNFSANNLVEQNQQTFNELYLTHLDTIALYSQSDVNQLYAIANQCATNGGDAVYQSRNLLMAIENRVIDFIENCEEISNQNNDRSANSIKQLPSTVRLYPNPNNGSMTLEYSLKENETGMFNLYNITGTLICSHPLQKNNPKLFINNDELEAGIYLYDVSINNKKIKTNKMVIIK